jgi:hypothetical protein
VLRLRTYCPSCTKLVDDGAVVVDDGADGKHMCPECHGELQLTSIVDFEQDVRRSLRGRVGNRGWMAVVSRASIRRRSH